MIEKREGQGAGERDVENEKTSNGLEDRQGGIRKYRQGVRRRRKEKEENSDGLKTEREELKNAGQGARWRAMGRDQKKQFWATVHIS